MTFLRPMEFSMSCSSSKSARGSKVVSIFGLSEIVGRFDIRNRGINRKGNKVRKE